MCMGGRRGPNNLEYPGGNISQLMSFTKTETVSYVLCTKVKQKIYLYIYIYIYIFCSLYIALFFSSLKKKIHALLLLFS